MNLHKSSLIVLSYGEHRWIAYLLELKALKLTLATSSTTNSTKSSRNLLDMTGLGDMKTEDMVVSYPTFQSTNDDVTKNEIPTDH